MKTRLLSLYSLAFSIWFLAWLVEFCGIPFTSLMLALFIPILGWKRVLRLRLFLSLLSIILNPQLLLFAYAYSRLNPFAFEMVYSYVAFYHLYFLFLAWLNLRDCSWYRNLAKLKFQ